MNIAEAVTKNNAALAVARKMDKIYNILVDDMEISPNRAYELCHPIEEACREVAEETARVIL